MADNSGGGNTILAVLVGALLVIVIGFFVFRGVPGTGHSSGPGTTLTVNTGKG